MSTSGYTNIILIVADDLGVGDIGHFGNPYAQTPALDLLAREGVALTQHYSASPLGAPARAALLCGRYSQRTGAIDGASNRGIDRISLRETTLADLFQSAGFATGMIGKWHNGAFDRRYHPNSRGFNEFAGFLNGGMAAYNWVVDVNGVPRRADGRCLTDVFTRLATGFVKRHKDQPFFLYLAYNVPHGPLMAPERDVQAFRDAGRLNEAVCRLYAMVQRMDAGIGELMAALETLGIAEDTLVLFTSDNGPWLGTERLPDGRVFPLKRTNGLFRGMKLDVLEGGIRVPALIRWPARLPAGTTLDAMVHFCDWLPTLAAAGGVTARPALPIDGVNVLPLLTGEAEIGCDRRFWQFNRYEPVPGCNAAMRDGPWKLVWPTITEAMARLSVDEVWDRGMHSVPHFECDIDPAPIARDLPGSGRPALYNIEDDPSERDDLAARHPDRMRAMQGDLVAWFAEVNAERRNLPDAWIG